MDLVIIGFAISSLVNGWFGKTNMNNSLQYQKERDTITKNQRDREYFATQQRHHTSLAQQAHLAERQGILQRDLQRSQQQHSEIMLRRTEKRSNSPFCVPYDELIHDTHANRMRVFVRHPKYLTLRGKGNDEAWNDIHSADLTDNLRQFLAKYYPDHIDFYEPDIFNPKGLRDGHNVIRTLSRELPSAPSLWLQADRVSYDETAIGMGCWGGDFRHGHFTPLGRVPNYNLAQQAMQQSMAASMLFDTQDILPSLAGHKRMDDVEKAEIQQAIQEFTALKELCQQQQAVLEETNNEYGTAAIRYLADAYKLLIATGADLFFLKTGASPRLPDMIRQGDIAMDDKFVKAATSQIMAHYLQAAITLSSELPAQSHLIWLSMADSFEALKQYDAAKDAIICALKACAIGQNLPRPESMQQMQAITAHLNASLLGNNFCERFTHLSHTLGLASLSITLNGNLPPQRVSKTYEAYHRFAQSATRATHSDRET